MLSNNQMWEALLKKYGWHEATCKNKLLGKGWQPPNITDGMITDNLPYLSLDNLFKWVIELNEISNITFNFASNGVICDIQDYSVQIYDSFIGTISITEAKQKTLEALLSACYKVLIGEK